MEAATATVQKVLDDQTAAHDLLTDRMEEMERARLLDEAHSRVLAGGLDGGSPCCRRQ